MGIFDFLRRKSKEIEKESGAEKTEIPEAVAENEKEQSVEPENKVPVLVEKRHRVAGVSYREKEIIELTGNNSSFYMKKSEIIENGMTNQRIWQYEFESKNVELVPEPENEHDKNAVKVVVDGVHIGYIKAGSCSHIKKLQRAGRIKYIYCKICGGKYKKVNEIFDDEDEEITYEMEISSGVISASLIVGEMQEVK